MGNFINLIGLIAANTINVFVARISSLNDGIYAYEDINDPSTKTSIKSKIIGKKALYQCCISRATMPVIYFNLPPTILWVLTKVSLLPKNLKA